MKVLLHLLVALYSNPTVFVVSIDFAYTVYRFYIVISINKNFVLLVGHFSLIL